MALVQSDMREYPTFAIPRNFSDSEVRFEILVYGLSFLVSGSGLKKKGLDVTSEPETRNQKPETRVSKAETRNFDFAIVRA